MQSKVSSKKIHLPSPVHQATNVYLGSLRVSSTHLLAGSRHVMHVVAGHSSVCRPVAVKNIAHSSQ